MCVSLKHEAICSSSLLWTRRIFSLSNIDGIRTRERNNPYLRAYFRGWLQDKNNVPASYRYWRPMSAHEAPRLMVAWCDRRTQSAPLSFGDRLSATVDREASDGDIRFFRTDSFPHVELDVGGKRVTPWGGVLVNAALSTLQFGSMIGARRRQGIDEIRHLCA